MYKLLILFLALQGCGSGDHSSPDHVGKALAKSGTEATEAPQVEEPTIDSISLSTAADLPDCLKANNHQLAYILSEELFYTCSDLAWARVEIKGKDGSNGVKGADGISNNSSNLWHDQITGLDWLLGGPGTAWNAESACSNGYREPSNAEGLAAALHGVRAIAGVLGLNLEFWTGIGNDASYVGLTAGVVSLKAGITTDARSIFCVKG